jgi:inhibitor of cysteine peptidase
MKKLLWLILIVLVAFPVIAQDNPAELAFEPLQVNSVRLRLSEADGASLVFNASPAVCAPLMTDINIDGDIIDVHVYAPPTEDNAVCTMIAPFEPVLQLGQLEVDTFYKLFLNDFSTLFFLPRVGGVIMDVQFPMTWGEDNQLVGFNRVDAMPDKVVFGLSDANTVTTQLTGYHPDGCISEEVTWIRQDELDSSLHHVELFRLLPEMVMCPAMLQELDTTVDTGIAADKTALFQIGDKLYRYDPKTQSATVVIRRFVTVESVAVSVNGDAYDVAIMGTQDGSCGVELRELVAERDYAGFVQIFDDVPEIAPCTMEIAFYQNTFTVRTLPVIVNGVAYDENGIVTQASSQTVPRANTGDGNFMQVDTVIESVDVVILESFPMQLHLTVKGYQPDGCDFPVFVEQQRDGNAVTVHVYREVPADVMCPMMLVSYEDTIVLDGSFESGTAHIKVNEFIVDVDL